MIVPVHTKMNRIFPYIKMTYSGQRSSMDGSTMGDFYLFYIFVFSFSISNV